MLMSFVLMLHFILNLYILHKFVIINKKVEEITDFEEWKNKASAYCEQDCKALYHVIINFNNLAL